MKKIINFFTMKECTSFFILPIIGLSKDSDNSLRLVIGFLNKSHSFKLK
jgi:hypothetical protein